MNARLHPIFQQALAPFVMTPPPVSTGYLLTTIDRWAPGEPSHIEIAGVLARLATAIKPSGYLTDKCRASVVDQLGELANEVDQDETNQRNESPDCGVSPPMREIEKLIEAFPTKLERKS